MIESLANGSAVAMLLVAALDVPGAMFLVLELNAPVGGAIPIARAPMDAALSHLWR